MHQREVELGRINSNPFGRRIKCSRIRILRFFRFQTHNFLHLFEMTYQKVVKRKKSLIFPTNRLLKLKIWLDYDANVIT